MSSNIRQVIRAQATSEGAGVTVHRTIGTPARRNLDPFLMLDHFSSDDPDDYIAGFPDHPHRGFITVTYMLDGHMLHRDSMGNRGDLRAGGVQWMKAASGIIHSEMPQQSEGLMRGFQLWINLPSVEKMSTPAYQEFSPEAIPEVTGDGISVRVISGEYGGQRGPIDDPHTDARYLHVQLQPEQTFSYPMPAGYAGFAYVFEGELGVEETVLAPHSLVIFGDHDRAVVKAGPEGAAFILVAGRPLGEPIVQFGPFVMNTREEVEQAYADFRDGRLVRSKAEMISA